MRLAVRSAMLRALGLAALIAAALAGVARADDGGRYMVLPSNPPGNATTAANLSRWTTQIHQNTQTGSCYGTGSGRVICTSDQNHDLIADHSTIQTQDASMITYLAVGGSITANDVVGLNWAVAGVTYQIRYTVQPGDTTALIAAALANCINAGSGSHCTVTSGFLAGLLAFHDANGFGYQPRASVSSASTVAFDQPWAASGNSVTTSLSGGATETLTLSAGNILDNGPYMGPARLVPGRTPVAADQLGAHYFQGQSAANSGIDTVYGSVFARVLVQDATNPQGELIFGTSDSGSARNHNPKLYLGRGAVFADSLGANCGYQGLGSVSVCGPLYSFYDSAGAYPSSASRGMAITTNFENDPLSNEVALWNLQSAASDSNALFSWYKKTGGSSAYRAAVMLSDDATYTELDLLDPVDPTKSLTLGWGAGGSYVISTGADLAVGKAGGALILVGSGAQIGSPTGGDKGANTLNVAGAIYANGTPLGTASLAATGASAHTVPFLDGNNAWTAGQAVTPTAGGNTGTATVTPDAATSNGFTYTLTGNITLANPSNPKAGQALNFQLTQDGTGSRTIALGSQYKFAAGTAPVWSTGAGKIDILTCWFVSTTVGQCTALIDVR